MTLPPFQRLLEEHSPALHRFCVAQAGPHHGPDCFQEAVLAALRAYPTLTDASNLKGWLFTIAHRKVIDHHRRASRTTAVADASAVISASGGGGVALAPAPPEVAADHHVWAAVQRLPEAQRSAVALRYLADLAYAEIAVALGCSEAAARQRVRAGLTTLRQEVTP